MGTNLMREKKEYTIRRNVMSPVFRMQFYGMNSFSYIDNMSTVIKPHHRI